MSSGFLCVLLLPPVSPVPRGPSRLKSLGPDRLQFCVYARQTALFAHSLKTVLTKSFCIWILYTPHCDRNNSCNIILLKLLMFSEWTLFDLFVMQKKTTAYHNKMSFMMQYILFSCTGIIIIDSPFVKVFPPHKITFYLIILF